MNQEEFYGKKYQENLERNAEMTNKLRVLKFVAWVGWGVFIANLVNEAGLAEIIDPSKQTQK